MTTPSPAVPTTTAPQPPRSRRRRWAFRGLTVLLACSLLGGCELVLRLAGVGTNYDLVVPVAGTPPVLPWQLNSEIDRVYFGTDMHGPEPRRFVLPKPVGVYRIVFLGESTVNGFPYACDVAFPRQVEHLLEAQRPGVDVEVLNAGITAINSFEIADLATRCARCEPDLVVIHAGHNEFFGPGGPGSAVLPLPPALVRLTFAVRRTRIGQLLGRLLPMPPPDGRHPLEALPRLTGIRRNDPEFAQAADNFRENLQSAVQSLRRAGTPVLLSTVACNLRDQGPLRNVWPAGHTAAQIAAVEAALVQAVAQQTQGQSADALATLELVAGLGTESATWHFRRGQSLYALGQFEGAGAAFAQARDLDGCRFRAPGEFASLVQEIAQQANDPEVRLLDTAVVVAQASPHGIPGHELFLEHVHYNLAGHRLLARAFAAEIQTAVLGDTWSSDRELPDARVDELLGLLPEDELTGLSLAYETVQTRPLADAADEMRVAEHLKSEIGRSYNGLSPERRAGFGELSLHEMQQDLPAALARQAARAGAVNASVTFAQAGIARRPWSPQAWLVLAQARAAAGDAVNASADCREVLKLSPFDKGALALRDALKK